MSSLFGRPTFRFTGPADKVWRQLRREGIQVARCTVDRLMKHLGLKGVRCGKVIRTTVPDRAQPCPQDRVNRRFWAERPNQLWVSDFTYVSTWQGWLYVAFVIDVFARRIVGWRVSTHMRTDKYLSIRYTGRLTQAGIELSVGSRGDSYAILRANLIQIASTIPGVIHSWTRKSTIKS